jgi:hypothetical protein
MRRSSWVAAVALVGVLAASLVASPAQALPAYSGTVKPAIGLDLRATPHTSDRVSPTVTVAQGARVYFDCQVNSDSYGGSTLWNHVVSPVVGWMPDAYISTGHVSQWAPTCAATTAGLCPAYELIGARGSGEPLSSGMGETVTLLAKQAASVLGTSKTRLTSVGYPALPVTADALLSGDFVRSILTGRNLVLSEVRLQIARCPSMHIGLIGYSQGAAVVSEAARSLTASERTHVHATAVVADPYSYGGSTSYAVTYDYFNWGNSATRLGSGGLGRKLLPDAAKSLDVCYRGDVVCDTPGSTSAALAQALVVGMHTTYKSNQFVTGPVANWIAAKTKA